MSDGRWAVLLGRQELMRDPRVTQTLATRLKLPFADAARRVTIGWGIIGERLEEGAALELGEALKAAGVETRVIPEGELPVLPEAQPVAAAGFGPSSVKLFARGDPLGEEQAFGDILVLAAAAWQKETMRTVKVKEGPTPGQKMATWGLRLATGLPLRIGPKEKEVEKVEKSKDLVFRIQLLTRQKTAHFLFQIDAEDFNYACLGPKMEYGTYGNFRSLLAAFRERAPQAALNRGASVLLASQPVGTMGYDGPRDLERELRWLRAILR